MIKCGTLKPGMALRFTPCLVQQFSLESYLGGEFTKRLFNTREIAMLALYLHLDTQHLQ
jgi:hypothetical protein